MAKFIVSAFADEASGKLDEQIDILKSEGISMLEIRGVDGINCSDLSIEQATAIDRKLSANRILLSALGSPYGKIGITDSFDEHLKKFSKSLEVCKILNCKQIRMFSFYLPQGANPNDYKDEVFTRLDKMINLADKAGVLLTHENEKGIYGDTDERCMELYEKFGGSLGVVFDPANYVQCGVDPKSAYSLQKDTITYFHMKDALKADGSVVSVGNGDGSLAYILNDVNKTRDQEVILTIEPHLHIFKGLENLQDEKLLNKESYPDSVTAFKAANRALNKLLNEL